MESKYKFSNPSNYTDENVSSTWRNFELIAGPKIHCPDSGFVVMNSSKTIHWNYPIATLEHHLDKTARTDRTLFVVFWRQKWNAGQRSTAKLRGCNRWRNCWSFAKSCRWRSCPVTIWCRRPNAWLRTTSHRTRRINRHPWQSRIDAWFES